MLPRARPAHHCFRSCCLLSGRQEESEIQGRRNAPFSPRARRVLPNQCTPSNCSFYPGTNSAFSRSRWIASAHRFGPFDASSDLKEMTIPLWQYGGMSELSPFTTISPGPSVRTPEQRAAPC